MAKSQPGTGVESLTDWVGVKVADAAGTITVDVAVAISVGVLVCVASGVCATPSVRRASTVWYACVTFNSPSFPGEDDGKLQPEAADSIHKNTIHPAFFIAFIVRFTLVRLAVGKIQPNQKFFQRYLARLLRMLLYLLFKQQNMLFQNKVLNRQM